MNAVTDLKKCGLEDFQILKNAVHGKRLAYLDNAATTQKPDSVLNAIQQYYQSMNANVHRGVHYLSGLATAAYESARIEVQKFINAPNIESCIFVKSATEAINLVATSFGERYVEAGDEILITQMEHHSNIVPWQMLCQRKKAVLKYIPITQNGELDLTEIDNLINEKTKLVAVAHVSNVLGTVNPIHDIIKKAHAKGAYVLVDGAQAAAHIKIDVQALDCDFYTFSSHKVYGPTGIGVLYGKAELLRKLPPYQGGGDMILKVSMKETQYNDIPFKFEAGTPPIAAAIGLKTALMYIENIGFEVIQAHEKKLLDLLTEILQRFPEIQIIGNPKEKIGVVSFNMEGVHPHDIGTIADTEGVALRTGHHCAMPLMEFFGVPGTTRVSLGLYNNVEDITQLEKALKKVREIFRR